jgi:pimeloyl-ACP methyl ester carboxylesterase
MGRIFSPRLLLGVAAALNSCDVGLTCGEVEANGLAFDCRFAGPEGGEGVLLLHGFPGWAGSYAGLMVRLADRGYRSVACNLRGYSHGAAPDSPEEYHFIKKLVPDVFAIADAVSFREPFHLVGHDIGALLGWVSTAAQPSRVRSFTSLSVPHPDALSAGLYGPTADPDQVVASQYISMLQMNNSASLNFQLFYRTLGQTSDPAFSAGFADAEAFQKAAWWYRGAAAAGVVAQPRVLPASELLRKGGLRGATNAILRLLFPGEDAARAGVAQRRPTGQTSVPTLFVCGRYDAAFLCTKPFALQTEAYVSAQYQYLAVDCAHDLVSAECHDVDRVVEAMLAHMTVGNGNHEGNHEVEVV